MLTFHSCFHRVKSPFSLVKTINSACHFGNSNPFLLQVSHLNCVSSVSTIFSSRLSNVSSRHISQYYDPTECEKKWYNKQSTYAIRESKKFEEWPLNASSSENRGQEQNSTNDLENGSFGGLVRNKDTFSIMLPPPNITGRLHIGHALTLSIEDALTRYHLMLGKRSVFVPGIDHAGISTQVVVEKRLAKENKFRKDMSRSDFLVEMMKWKEIYQGMIQEQIKGLGAICDWDRHVFTMDPEREVAVKEAFIRLFDNKYIYREKKLVNWCCHLQTAISDIEVENFHVKKATSIFVPSVNRFVKFGVLHHFKYPLLNEDGSPSSEQFIQVSTTRIETMLGDTAIAIHSSDERYKQYHGKFCIHPFTNRKLPIICDDVLVDPTFGTGAVKITPAHDFNDFECGRRHNLESVIVFDRQGNTIQGISEELFGLESVDRYVARDKIIEALKKKNLYVGEEDHDMQLPLCERSKDVLEPMLLPQWFVKCKDLANEALDLTDSGVLRIHPDRYRNTWQRWLENIHDWCISRQLWWGHQIPAYEIHIFPNQQHEDQEQRIQVDHLRDEINGQWVAAHNLKSARVKALQKFPALDSIAFELVQDEDVLDTWFSSGLYPIAGLGWPNTDSLDLKNLYPLSLLETGEDILFFWAARMVMLCTYLYQPIEGKKLPPFNDIYLHSMVRDSQGRKMSKSLGNVIDPMDLKHGKELKELEHDIINNTNISQNEVKKALSATKSQFPSGIPSCGVDAMRFTLLEYTNQGRSINLDINKVVSNRQFCNKIWQATRFVEKYLSKYTSTTLHIPTDQEVGIHNQWILAELSMMLEQYHRQMEDYLFSNAAATLHDFFLFKFCDVYLEISKRHLNNPSSDAELKSTLSSLKYILDIFLRGAHPFLPFITDELWHSINPSTEDTILSSTIPTSLKHLENKEALEIMSIHNHCIQKIRSIKVLLVEPSDAKLVPIRIRIDPNSENCHMWNQENTRAIIGDLTNSQNIDIKVSANDVESEEVARFTIYPNCRLFIPFSAKKIEESIKKLEKELKSLQNAKDKLIHRIEGVRYSNTPEAIQAKDQETLELWMQKEQALNQDLTILKDIQEQTRMTPL